MAREVKARERVLYGDGKVPPRPADIKKKRGLRLWRSLPRLLASPERPHNVENIITMSEDGVNKRSLQTDSILGPPEEDSQPAGI